MTIFAVLRGRAATFQPLALRTTSAASRCFINTYRTAYSGPEIDFDHFASGWKNVGDIGEFTQDHGTYQLHTFNKISPEGLAVFPKGLYDVRPHAEAGGRPAHALMLRSHKLKEEEVAPSVRCIARCGAGTNNIRKFFNFLRLTEILARNLQYLFLVS